jgi:DNA mismatch repair protein MutS
VVSRANEILGELEAQSLGKNIQQQLKKQASPSNMQLSFFQMDDPKLRAVAEALQKMDIDTLTPVEALMKLSELRKMMDDD